MRQSAVIKKKLLVAYYLRKNDNYEQIHSCFLRVVTWITAVSKHRVAPVYLNLNVHDDGLWSSDATISYKLGLGR